MALTYSQAVADQQKALNTQYNAGLKVDGLLGPLTQAAITKYANQTTTSPTRQTTQGTVTPAGIVNFDPNTGQRLSTGQTVTVAPGGNTYGSNIIPTSTLGTNTALKIPSATPTNTADVAVAGATSASTQMTADQKALADKTAADQSNYDKLSGEISTLLGTATGQGQATLDAETKAGVPQMQQQLQGINNQITNKLAEFKVIQDKYAETTQAVEQRTIPMENIIGRNAEINRSLALQKNTFASEIGLLQAQAQGVQGQLELAKATADRAVDLKYEDIKTQIQVKMQQLDMVRDMLTADEKKQAAALDSQYQTAQNNLSIQIANEKDKNSTLLSAMQKYPDAGISLTDTIEQANAKVVANSAIYKDAIRAPSSGGSGGTSTGTAGERLQSTISSYSSVFQAGKALPDGTPIIDQNGFATTTAWKKLIADAVANGVSRADFIKQFGYLLYAEDGVPSSNYGLTASELKLV
jgi:hypothetical protein